MGAYQVAFYYLFPCSPRGSPFPNHTFLTLPCASSTPSTNSQHVDTHKTHEFRSLFLFFYCYLYYILILSSINYRTNQQSGNPTTLSIIRWHIWLSSFLSFYLSFSLSFSLLLVLIIVSANQLRQFVSLHSIMPYSLLRIFAAIPSLVMPVTASVSFSSLSPPACVSDFRRSQSFQFAESLVEFTMIGDNKPINSFPFNCYIVNHEPPEESVML